MGARALALVGVVACVQSTTRIFLPSPQNPSYSLEQANPVLAEYLRLQCPAFQKASKPDTGVVRFTVSLDSTGAATRAELEKASGDQLVDEVFGTIAAQLRFAPDSARARMRRETVNMHYRCAGDSAFVTIK
ncbi:MAG: hypothetical protein H7066_17795 [Cytophagaceae bacterium]|nr:hypothetical protein [Gemmatimonadaceae bacterium]